MFVRRQQDVPPVDLSLEQGVKGAELRPLITREDGAGHFAMRLFRLEPGGHTPFHVHPWEHEVFIVRGSGELLGEGAAIALAEGMAAYVPPDERHRFRAGDRGMTFICCIPHAPAP
ncbi:MAG: cupin domain-containing protein [bacterium]